MVRVVLISKPILILRKLIIFQIQFSSKSCFMSYMFCDFFFLPPLFRPWKFEHIGIGLLSLLLRDDRVLPLRAIRFFVENLNHDAIVVRKVDTLL